MIAEADDTPVPPLDEQGRVAVDVPCVKCCYDLRTIDYSGCCPECGDPVGASISAHLHRPSEWLQAVGESSVQMGFALVIPLILVLIGAAKATDELVLLAFILVVVFVPTCVVLLFKLTRPEPAASPQHFPARRLIRLCLISSAAGVAAPEAFRFLVSTAEAVGMTLLFSGLALLPLAILRHIWLLLRRTARQDLREHAQILFWSVLGLEALACGCFAADASGFVSTDVLTVAKILCAGVAICVFFAAQVLLVRAGRALKAVAEQTRCQVAQFIAEHPSTATGTRGADAEGSAIL